MPSQASSLHQKRHYSWQEYARFPSDRSITMTSCVLISPQGERKTVLAVSLPGYHREWLSQALEEFMARVPEEVPWEAWGDRPPGVLSPPRSLYKNLWREDLQDATLAPLTRLFMTLALLEVPTFLRASVAEARHWEKLLSGRALEALIPAQFTIDKEAYKHPAALGALFPQAVEEALPAPLRPWAASEGEACALYAMGAPKLQEAWLTVATRLQELFPPTATGSCPSLQRVLSVLPWLPQGEEGELAKKVLPTITAETVEGVIRWWRPVASAEGEASRCELFPWRQRYEGYSEEELASILQGWQQEGVLPAALLSSSSLEEWRTTAPLLLLLQRLEAEAGLSPQAKKALLLHLLPHFLRKKWTEAVVTHRGKPKEGPLLWQDLPRLFPLLEVEGGAAFLKTLLLLWAQEGRGGGKFLRPEDISFLLAHQQDWSTPLQWWLPFFQEETRIVLP